MLYVDMNIPKETTQSNLPKTYQSISKIHTGDVCGCESARKQDLVVSQTNNSKHNSLKYVRLYETVRT